uniref:THAP domain-containing protein 2 n=1 Tax=Caligus clemensi TaxID=344056 RepID=C1C0H7_CALCM|nr:THAP domain-containing protein 2 [Caligus clemensi]
MSCAAFGCKNQCSPKSDVSFHRFPRDPELRQEWVRNLKKADFTPKEHSRICSEHFTPECFNRTLNVVRLRDNALPTIFKGLPKHLQEEVAKTRRKRKSPKYRPSFSSKAKRPPQPQLHISFFDAANNIQLDHSYSLPSSSQLIKRELQVQIDTISELSRRSKQYRQKQNQLAKRVARLVCIIKDLRSKGTRLKRKSSKT